jgi:dienelactone hydrolase
MLADRASQLADALPGLPDSQAAWTSQREQIIEKLGDALGLPERAAMAAGTLQTLADGDLVVEQVAYHWAGELYVSGNVIRLRESTGRSPALIISPDWMGHYTWSIYRPLVEQLAREGFVVLFVDDPHIGRRQAAPAGLYVSSAAAGTSVMGIRVHDVLRGLDYLATRDEVDPMRIGVAGLGQGAMTAWMAAALEPRLRFVVPVCGTVSFARLAEGLAGDEPIEDDGLKDPSTFVPGMLATLDMPLVAACVAPRPVLAVQSSEPGLWSAAGTDEVLDAFREACGLLDAADALKRVSKPMAHSMAAATGQIVPWVVAQAESMPEADKGPLPCGQLPEEPQFKLIPHFVKQAAEDEQPGEAPASPEACRQRREELVAWLREAGGVGAAKLDAGTVKKRAEKGPLAIETLRLSNGFGGTFPGVLVHPAGAEAGPHPAVILSHGGYQCVNDSRVVVAVRELAAKGYWVVVPEHISSNEASLRSVGPDRMGVVYGMGDAVGLSPLAMRVIDNLAAVEHLASREEVDGERIVIAGLDVGAVDAALAAALDERIGAASCLDPMTYEVWAAEEAPEALYYLGAIPYLPKMIGHVDTAALVAAVAPRPLVAVLDKAEGSEAAFAQITESARQVFELLGSKSALQVLTVREMNEGIEQSAEAGLPRQAVAAARALSPEPPAPGLVGTVDGLKSRGSVDSAEGLVWLLDTVARYKQRFVEGGYEVREWSFYNDNKQAQAGRVITPLIFKKVDDRYEITGIGKTRSNDGSGLQTFPFEAMHGSAEVGREYFFGWHTGDGAGKTNPGVVEYDQAADSQATILGGSGALNVGQRLGVRNSYPRIYSIQAASKKSNEATTKE